MTTLVPVTQTVSGDLNTPVSLYTKLNTAKTPSFLLESVIGGEQLARYSFIGFNPFCEFVAHESSITIIKKGIKTELTGNPIDQLQKALSEYTLEDQTDLPPLVGGAVGYFSWETIQYIEPIQFTKGKSDYPLAHFLIPKQFFIFDNAHQKIICLVLCEKGQESEAKPLLDDMFRLLNRPCEAKPLDLNPIHQDHLFENVSSNYKKEDFKADVEKVKRHIVEGDVFQLVLSQRFTISSPKSPFEIYRKLRLTNPSPYMYYFNFNDYRIIGSSPEILTRLENQKASLRPIAGTRPRSKTNEEAVIQELLADEKERAEHLMLVDLGRNDLGRVCDYASIQTKDLMTIEKYSHVIHIVSHIDGKLRTNKNAFDLFKATFPAGTLSGAPKVRAIELIEEIEPTRRGLYGGALGYFDFRGNMDLCIIIRTLLEKNGRLEIQAGAGIVADSDPEMEYLESQNKAKGMISACY